jgi:signal transduction histidine kinase
VAPEVRITAPPRKDGLIEIVVADNGIGFEEKYATRIFGMLQRLHGREEFEGTGMGLAICRRVVARHGGEITAQSKLGAGATFTITFPATQENGEMQ